MGNATFNEQLASLNAEQRRAVETIEGPLLVIAGPGTGKTQLLSSRVAQILTSTDTSASNILCLTFTNKAATNMRDRLMQITDGKARDTVVKTFHSFASEIMNMYPDHFWNGARLSTAPDAVQHEIIQGILSDLPLDNPLALKFAGAFTLIPDVSQALKLAKEAGLTPDKLEALIQTNIAYLDLIESDLAERTDGRLSIKTINEFADLIRELPDQATDTLTAPLISLSTTIKESLDHAIELDTALGKTTNTGAWKRRWIQTLDGQRGMHTERARNMWWLALADVYRQYRDLLHARNYYDYADMLVEVLSQLESNPGLRADIQEKFLYVMIDEFQDTNAAQLRLAHLVADHHSANGNPNLMAVGDDDQSIFKFNGAELNNMLSFKRSYPACELIVLTQNYRSTQAILDTAGGVITHATDRLVDRDTSIIKTLHAANSSISQGTIEHTSFRTREEQLNIIANTIAQSYSPEKTVAIIARGHSSLREIATQLLARDVPVHYEQQRNILEHDIIEQVRLIAHIIRSVSAGDNVAANVYLSKSLRHPMWQIDPKTLWELATQNYRSPQWLDSLIEHDEEQLQYIGQLFLKLSQTLENEPLAVCIEYLLGLRMIDSYVSPIRAHFGMQNDDINTDYLHGLSAMQALRNLALEFSPSEQATLADFITFIELEKANGTVISDESPFVSGDNAVSLLTVHKSKGLEFDEVYIIDAIENNWQPRKGGRKPPANLPLQPAGDTIDDYARLMFVAVTRAKSSLHISSYRFDANGSELLASPLINTTLPATDNRNTANIIEILETSLQWPRLASIDEKRILSSRLGNYSLSVTHLLNFLDVTNRGPQHFLERNILRLPEAKSSSMAHGTAMHAALEHAQKLINADSYDIELIKNTYIQALTWERLPAAEAERYFVHGPQLLERLLGGSLLQLKKGNQAEQNINDVRLGEARLGGKLDIIETTNTQLIVSDYKTGRPVGNFATKDATQMVRAWKQRTQLIYYAILLNNSARIPTQGKQITGQMIYLDATTTKDMYKQYEASPEEIDRLQRLILAIWPRIINFDLPDTTGYSEDYAGIVQFEEDLLNQKI